MNANTTQPDAASGDAGQLAALEADYVDERGELRPNRRKHPRRPDRAAEELFNGFANLIANIGVNDRYWHAYLCAMRQSFADYARAATPQAPKPDTPPPTPAEGARKPPIPATWFHGEGAYAQCYYCHRYSLDPQTLGDRPPACECGEKLGWSGSFKPPGPDAKWSDASPPVAAPQAQAVAWPSGLWRRVREAANRISGNYSPRRIPAEPGDVDLVLAEIQLLLEGREPPSCLDKLPREPLGVFASSPAQPEQCPDPEGCLREGCNRTLDGAPCHRHPDGAAPQPEPARVPLTIDANHSPIASTLLAPRRAAMTEGGKLPEPEFSALMDHIYEYGTMSEGIVFRARCLIEAAHPALASRIRELESAAHDHRLEVDALRLERDTATGRVSELEAERDALRAALRRHIEEFAYLCGERQRYSRDDLMRWGAFHEQALALLPPTPTAGEPQGKDQG
jgi:hypothetical protein